VNETGERGGEKKGDPKRFRVQGVEFQVLKEGRDGLIAAQRGVFRGRGNEGLG